MSIPEATGPPDRQLYIVVNGQEYAVGGTASSEFEGYLRVPVETVRHVIQNADPGGDMHIRILPSTTDTEAYSLADDRIRIEPQLGRLYADDRRVRLSSRSFELLAYLGRRPAQIATYETLAGMLWRGTQLPDYWLSLVVQQMHTIRGRLGPELGDPITGVIRNARNVGYFAVKSLQAPLYVP